MNKNTPTNSLAHSVSVLAATCLLGSVAHAATGDTLTLKSKDLEVKLDKSFPQVISYSQIKSGAQIHGQSEKLTQFLLNDKPYTAKVEFVKSKSTDKLATYKLTFPDAGNLTMDAEISVDGPVLTFKIKNIKEGKGFKLASVEIPNHGILSVDSKQGGAQVSSAIINTDQSKRMDTFLKVDSRVKPEKRSAAYVIVNTNKLAATLVNNSAYDIDKDDRHAAPNENNDALDPNTKPPIDNAVRLGNGRVRIAIDNKDNKGVASLSSGQWTYRAMGSKITTKELWTKVIITGDRNGDHKIDWQDGAVAFRDIMQIQDKKGKTPNRVAQHISFNFGSAAGEPFPRVLDNLKRVHYVTDGLGQFIVLKGYASEGHDSAHPDYAGHIGIRQGGAEQMNYMVDQAAKWNAEVGVHINCQEAYPEAKTFEEDMIFKDKKGWDWIDFSYIMNHRWDITSGAFEKRISDMKKEVPGLDFIYMDVYWGDGWLAQEMARILDRNNLGATTEFPSMLEHASTWSHWATDVTYGPNTRRGINSHIIRFIRNHEKDTYLRHPLLGHAELGDFETWQGRTNFNQFVDKVFSAALPSKFVQHHKILKWGEHDVKLTDGVTITDQHGYREMFQNDRKILAGSTYLLPWKLGKETKLYHWNREGGSSTWDLPKDWTAKTVKLYQLSHTGRKLVADLPVTDGKITINAKARTPYVVYQTTAPKLPAPNWGEGTPVKDPGFFDSTLAHWKVSADKEVVSVVTDDHVRTALTMKPSQKTATVSQDITLKPGTYSASVWVMVDKAGARKASLTATPDGGKATTVWTDRSPVENTPKNSEWNRTRMQLMRTVFDVPAGKGKVTIALKADAGTSMVQFDDIRIQKAAHAVKKGYDFYQDFENVGEGWFPFVKGPLGGVEDPRTHLSELHAPFTNKGWNGRKIDDTLEGLWSLKSHRERSPGKKGNKALIYRTIPQTLRFEPGKKYEVSFDYQSCYSGEYDFVVGADADGKTDIILQTLPLEEAHDTKRLTVTIEPKKGQSVWIGVRRIESGAKHKDADLIIDNLGVKTLK